MKNKNIEYFYPLSPMQQGIFFHSIAAPDKSVYFEQFSWTIQGNLNTTAFRRAWEYIVERHSILRTCFVWEGLKEPVQVVHRQVKLPWVLHDWREIPSVQQQEQLAAFLESDRSIGFELTRPPLMRLTLHHLSENFYHFTWSHHHLLLDGWSVATIYKEVFDCYQAFSNGQDIYLKPIRSYRDYIVWLQQQNLSQAEAFWRQLLKGFTAPTRLWVNKGFGQLLSSKDGNNQQAIKLSVEKTAALQFLAQQHQLTLNTLVQGAWALLLSRYSGQEDVVFGATTSGRPPTLAKAESMVGLFINTLPVRVQVSSEEFFLPWLKQIQTQQIETRQYEYSPLVKVQGWSEVPKGLPLFETIVVFENYPVDASLRKLDLNLEIKSFSVFEKTNYPLTLVVKPSEELLLKIAYDDTEHFDVDTINRMLGHLKTLLEGIVSNPEQTVGQLPLLTEAERHQLLVEWNNTQGDYQVNKCIHHLFEEQAERTPDSIAVVFENQHLTYAQLNLKANQLAHYLQSQGVEPETLVGICIKPSLEMVVGLLGILKAGGAYVPLDPEYPQERLAFMLCDSGTSVLLTTSDTKLELLKHQACLIDINKNWEIICQENRENLIGGAKPEQLVYVIYTSGSTGKPKGVQISHQSVVNFLTTMQQQPGLTDQDVLLAVTTLSFDIAALELYLPLTVGARVVLISREVASDGIQLAQKLAKAAGEKGATVMQATPATWRLLLASGWQGSPHLKILVGGEALPQELATQLLDKGASVWNLYGPTETTIWSSVYKLKMPAKEACDTDALEYIGRPIANTQYYILDRHLQPTPIGVPGELYIGGAGLARGYLNASELNTEKFIPNPFSYKSETRLYKTGDLACYLSDGTVKFLGRIDNQVKIRGFRIELGEIEALLTKHPAVREVVVIGREMSAGDKRLIAYTVPDWNQTPTSVELRHFLQKQLPDYMVPTNFVMLKEMPLTPNGKINRRALPAPEQSLSQYDRFVPPRDRLELELTQIWSEVLNVNPVGVLDNFFELGGHSLLAISLMTRIQQKFGQILPLTTLFQGATVEQQAVLLRQQSDTHPWSPLVSIQPRGSKRPLFFIHSGGGSILSYLELARHLGTERPLYGLEANGFESGQEPHSQIEEMATHYIKAIQTVQPNGSYLLAGWSLGGVIAFEMAQQLGAQGQRTSLLAMMDIFNFSANSDRFTLDEAALLMSLFRNHLSLPEEQLQQVEANLRQMEVHEQVAYAIEQAKQHNLQLPPGFEVEQLGRLLKVRKFHACAAAKYVPRLHYPGTITLLQASEGNSANSGNPTLGWEALADKVELHWVPGNHLTIVQEPHVKVLAEKLQICLEQAQAKEL